MARLLCGLFKLVMATLLSMELRQGSVSKDLATF